jgi:hypothetical protein
MDTINNGKRTEKQGEMIRIKRSDGASLRRDWLWQHSVRLCTSEVIYGAGSGFFGIVFGHNLAWCEH